MTSQNQENYRQRMLSQIEDRITALQSAQSHCKSATDERAKRIGNQLMRLIRQRNELRTAEEIAQIERDRGIA